MLERLKTTKLSDLVNSKLADPNLALTPDEQLDVLRECIGRGTTHAKTAEGKDLLVVIGNTGAGKSTCVNFVDGCKLIFEKVLVDDGVGGSRQKKVVSVAPDSPRPMLMRVGHTNKSQTFVPDVRIGHEFVYCDCPGFLDNRGPEINIANAVNIKETVSRAKSTKVLVLLNYNSLLANRGAGLKELAEILISLFGSAEGVQKHQGNIVLGISRVPLSVNNELIELEEIRDHFAPSASAGLPPACAAVVAALAPTLFVFSPYGDGNESWLDREQVMAKLRALEPIADPTGIFKTVLNTDDERALTDVCSHLVARGEEQLKSNEYYALCATLEQIASLRMVGSGYVSELLAGALKKVRQVIDEKDHAVTRDVGEGKFERADKALGELEELAESIADAGSTIAASGLLDYVRDVLNKGTEFLAKRRADVDATDQLRSEYEEASLRATTEAEKNELLEKKSELQLLEMTKMKETSEEDSKAMERLEAQLKSTETDNAAALEKLRAESEADLERLRQKAVSAESDEVGSSTLHSPE